MATWLTVRPGDTAQQETDRKLNPMLLSDQRKTVSMALHLLTSPLDLSDCTHSRKHADTQTVAQAHQRMAIQGVGKSHKSLDFFN